MPKTPIDPNRDAAEAWMASFDPASWFDFGHAPAGGAAVPLSAAFGIHENPDPPTPYPGPLPDRGDPRRRPPFDPVPTPAPPAPGSPVSFGREGVYALRADADGVYRAEPQPELLPEPLSPYFGLPVAQSFGIKECACDGTCGGCGGA